MALKSNFDSDAFKNLLKEKSREIEERIEAALTYAGEEFIRDAREQPQDHEQGFYVDQTTNLRNSIGYYIFKNGELIKESETRFPEENKAEIAELVKPTGYQLIGIAGMYYAGYVEAKGYNVITLQADACMVNLGEYLKDIEQFVNR